MDQQERQTLGVLRPLRLYQRNRGDGDHVDDDGGIHFALVHTFRKVHLIFIIQPATAPLNADSGSDAQRATLATHLSVYFA